MTENAPKTAAAGSGRSDLPERAPWVPSGVEEFPRGVRVLALLTEHYRDEVRPYAEMKGYCRDAVRQAAHRALDRVFAEAWPAPTTEARHG